MVIIEFSGGLGNQMFQYAFYRKHQMMGKEVGADLEYFYGKNEDMLCIENAFPNISLNTIGVKEEKEKIVKDYMERNFLTRIIQKVFPKCKTLIYEKKGFTFGKENLYSKEGIYQGYWQTDKYWKDIKEVIIEDFVFKKIEDNKKAMLLESICLKKNSISIHVRRGDYLEEKNAGLYGNICTEEYYDKAINFFKEKINDPVFIVFSNDPEWVKNKYDKRNFVFASDYIDKSVPDWYEMYLMSICKHNIIANSTFSWWGAYLNRNIENLVIAPSKWINGYATKDIWPDGWIKI